MNPNPSQPPGKRGPPRLDPSAARLHKTFRVSVRTAQTIMDLAHTLGISQGQALDSLVGGLVKPDTPSSPVTSP